MTFLLCGLQILVALSVFLSPVLANDPIHQSVLDNQGLWPFVLASRPLWEFGVPSKGLCPTRTAPCYPDYPVDPVTLQQHPGGSLQAWPLASGGCRFPSASGGAGGIQGQPFPNFYIPAKCSDSEVRVGYWIYYPKDGFVGSGHPHDWEYYVMVWVKDGSGNYYRDRHLLSYHGGRLGTPWGSVKDTVNDDLSKASGGNHSKVYPGWSKHANFDTKKTTVCDTVLQSTLVAYRSDDWWYYPQPSDLILGDRSTREGAAIDDIGNAGLWGSADSWPAKTGPSICSMEATQDGFAKNDEDLTLGDLFPNGIPWNTTSTPISNASLSNGMVKRDYTPRGCGMN